MYIEEHKPEQNRPHDESADNIKELLKRKRRDQQKKLYAALTTSQENHIDSSSLFTPLQNAAMVAAFFLVSDRDESGNPCKFTLVSMFLKILGFSSDDFWFDFFLYPENENELIRELQNMNDRKKEFFVDSLWRLVSYEDDYRDHELSVALNLYKRIGVSDSRVSMAAFRKGLLQQ